MPQTRKLLILRFSAMGDVAMVASVLQEFSVQHPGVELVMVSRPAFAPFFADIPGLVFHAFHPKTTHKGIGGLFRLFRELLAYRPFAVADLHDNIRSRILCTFFRFAPVKIKRIDKGRAEKKALVRAGQNELKPLKPTVERYASVFAGLGYPVKLSHRLQRKVRPLPEGAVAFFNQAAAGCIGIAPFAQHIHKMYSLSKMQEVIEKLTALHYQVFIFGGGAEEQRIGDEWEKKITGVKNGIGKFTLKEELDIISHLDLMLSMDSSGMHMASLMGVPVISVWGPTHPYAGFLGYGQLLEDCIQADHPARPTSIYGNKPCLCGDIPCMDLIRPSRIVDAVVKKMKYG